MEYSYALLFLHLPSSSFLLPSPSSLSLSLCFHLFPPRAFDPLLPSPRPSSTMATAALPRCWWWWARRAEGNTVWSPRHRGAKEIPPVRRPGKGDSDCLESGGLAAGELVPSIDDSSHSRSPLLPSPSIPSFNFDNIGHL